ncbi:MAG TPA: transcriptional regulator [Syntrophus sp. (in: bacteria)]|jgi:CRP/FNR family transcriptional regulator|nr:transcriptional regulator [Syntrophus sp. (in: bacteria)]
MMTEKKKPPIPFFEGLSAQQQRDMFAVGISKTAERGQKIFFDGDRATGFYIVLSGKVKIYKLAPEGKEQILHVFGPGEPFGEVPTFANDVFPVHAQAVEKTNLLFFPRESFLGQIRQDPDLAMGMLATLSRRLLHMTKLVESLSLQNVSTRLAAYLVQLSEAQKQAATVRLDINKGQLASLLGTVPETLSRALNRLTNQNLIKVQGRQITIINRAGLDEWEETGL